MFAFPKMIAPAARSLATTPESLGSVAPFNAYDPAAAIRRRRKCAMQRNDLTACVHFVFGAYVHFNEYGKPVQRTETCELPL